MNRSVQSPRQHRAGSRRLILAWLPVCAWMALIFYFSAQPSLTSGLGIWDTILRKTAHMMEFAVLSVLVWRAIRQHGVRDNMALAAGSTIALLYAASDEYHQSFVFGRTGTIRDVAFDLAGIIIALMLIEFTVVRRNRSRNRKRPAR